MTVELRNVERHTNAQVSNATSEEGVLDNVIDLIEIVPNSVTKVGVLISRLDESEGAGNVALRQLTQLQEAGYEPTAITFDAETVVQGVETIELKSEGSRLGSNSTISRLKNTFWPPSLLRLAERLKQYDLLIVHQPVFCLAAYLTKRLYGTTTVYYNHHITEPSEKVGLVRSLFGHTAYRLMLYASSRLDLVVSVSEYSREAYVDRFGKSGPIIYNQIDTGTYNKTVSGTEIRAEYDLDQRPVILFVGRVARSKRVHELIEVYNNVLMSEPDTVLLIVGRSDNQKYSDRIQRCIDSSGGQIVQAGFVPEDELPSYYAAADVYATCSIKEGFNLTIAEAEACGTPTVAYDIGAHSEVMSNGTLVDQGNTDAFTQAILQTLSEDSDLH